MTSRSPSGRCSTRPPNAFRTSRPSCGCRTRSSRRLRDAAGETYEHGGPRDGPPSPPTFGAPRGTRGAPLYAEQQERQRASARCRRHRARRPCAHSSVESFGERVGGDPERAPAHRATRRRGVVEQPRAQATADHGRQHPAMLELHHRRAAAQHVKTDHGAAVLRAVDGRALDEPRRDRERVAPERDPLLGVPPVALGGVGDARERGGVGRSGAPDRWRQGSTERRRISSSSGAGTRRKASTTSGSKWVPAQRLISAWAASKAMAFE